MGSRRRAGLPSGVAVTDAWTADWSIGGADTAPIQQKVDDEQDVLEKKASRRARIPCECHCDCGAQTIDGGNRLCYLCGQGVHHVCSRACKAFEPVMTEWHGIRLLSNYVPPRRACGGGESR